MELGYDALNESLPGQVFIALDAGVVNELGGIVATASLDEFNLTITWKNFLFPTSTKYSYTRESVEQRRAQSAPIANHFRAVDKQKAHTLDYNVINNFYGSLNQHFDTIYQATSNEQSLRTKEKLKVRN